jgi:hypothetical protein
LQSSKKDNQVTQTPSQDGKKGKSVLVPKTNAKTNTTPSLNRKRTIAAGTDPSHGANKRQKTDINSTASSSSSSSLSKDKQQPLQGKLQFE